MHFLHRGKIHKILRCQDWEKEAEKVDRRNCKCRLAHVFIDKALPLPYKEGASAMNAFEKGAGQ